MPPRFRPLPATLLAAALLVAGPVSGASAGSPGGDTRAAAAAMKARAAAPPRVRANEVVVSDAAGSRVVRVRDVAKASRAIAKRAGVRSVTPNYLAHVSGWVPPDPGNAAAPAFGSVVP